MSANYPLLLAPHLAERVWGGDSLGEGIGEAWDLSVHPHGPCRIRNGPLRGETLADVAAASPADFGGPLRLLAKRLDCARDLSVQVHPKEGDPKTEAWVVLRARADAGIYHGFRRPVSTSDVAVAAQDGSLPALLRFLKVRPGECVFVPSGTVHAIGGGLLLFELQQSSDTTYRLYDRGRGRELHLEQALACSDLDAGDAIRSPRPAPDGSLRLVECEHFHIDRIDGPEPHRLDPGATWTAVHLVAGNARVDEIALGPGETLLVPTAAGPRGLEPDGACTALLYGP